MSDAAVAAATHGHGHVLSEAEQEYARGKLGMWLFLASEVMFFGGFIAAYVVLRMGDTHGVFDGTLLNWKIAAFNTVLLLTSSLTMALSIGAIQKGDVKGLQINLFLTILLGVGFLLVKFLEYGTKFLHGISPSTNIFYSVYFTLTGFHGLHVLGGIVVLSALLIWSMQGKYNDKNWAGIEFTGLYWHLVDIVWIFLFPILYLL